MNQLTKAYFNKEYGYAYYLRFDNSDMFEIELYASPIVDQVNIDYDAELLVEDFDVALTNTELSDVLRGIKKENKGENYEK